MRRLFAVLLGLVALPGALQAQTFPNRPVTMVVPFAAGGTGEILGRLLAQRMSTDLGQNVIVELKPGAGSMLGSEYVARSARADGYAMLLNGPPLTINAALMKLGFDPAKDIVPVSGVAGFPLLMLTSASSPYMNVGDVLKAAKSDYITFGSSGPGTATHMAGELFKSLSGAEMTHVPYKGSGAVYTDLIAGRVSVLFDLAASATGFVNQGKVRALGATSRQRLPGMPDLPTVAEQGVRGYEFLSWFGLFVRTGTPREAMERLEASAKTSLRDAALAERLKQLGALPLAQAASEFNQFYQADIERWAAMVRQGKVARLNE
ncbi:MAG: tripartite tricarboxylate transporter substrate binding protein [Gammaproteobacteria bacterium]|nr:tripartite tricarboxylate transporter substrate binding protein [Gammaproteobacteria bacterium]